MSANVSVALCCFIVIGGIATCHAVTSWERTEQVREQEKTRRVCVEKLGSPECKR